MRTRLPLALAAVAAFAAAVGCAAQPTLDVHGPDAIVWIAAPDDAPAGPLTYGPAEILVRAR